MQKISRQRRWQLKQIAQGLCSICGKRPSADKTRCAICAKIVNENNKIWHKNHPDYIRNWRKKHPNYSQNCYMKRKKAKDVR